MEVREASAGYLVAAGQRVPDGYKQTEAGVIPEDWEVKRFAEIAMPRRQRIDPRKSGTQDFCIELEHIGSTTGSLLGSTSAGEQSSLKSVFRTGDVLFGKLRAYLRKYWQADRPGVCSTEIWVLSPIETLFSSAYLFQIVQTDKFVEAASSSYGTHMPRSDWNVVKNYKLPLSPTKAEQEAIAEALSDADALIESMEQLLAKKRHLKQGAMQELLTGKKRLPGFSGEWEVKRLGDLCERITTGKLDANAMVQNGDYPFFTCAKEHYWIDRYAFDLEVLLVSGNGANVGYIHYYKGRFNAYQRTYVLSGFSCDIHFLKLFMERSLQDRIRTEMNAGNTPYIVMGTLSEMSIALPSEKAEQTAIATLLSDMDAELAALEAKLAKARNLKQGMMQELLTGRIRLV